MSTSKIKRTRLIQAAEGYLELGMPRHALEELARMSDSGTYAFEYNYLRGQALRDLLEHRDAIVAFEAALTHKPDHIGLLLALAWCYKRTQQVPRSIEMMERAYRENPNEALILYNMSCYYALLGNKPQALSWLGRALRMDAEYRDLIDEETDFDPIRNDPDFQLLLSLGTEEISE